MRILKVVRMFKLLRAAKFMEHLSKLEQKEGFQVVNMPEEFLRPTCTDLQLGGLGCDFQATGGGIE